MSELKFRAWSLGNKMKGIEPHYIEDFAIDAFYGTPKDIFDGNRSEDGIECIEQYTGLKDKNGREIYEGDILQNADGETATVVWCEETAEWGIEWSDCEVRDSLSWRMTCVKESDSLNEVIGNIHENPELLGGKK